MAKCSYCDDIAFSYILPFEKNDEINKQLEKDIINNDEEYFNFCKKCVVKIKNVVANGGINQGSALFSKMSYCHPKTFENCKKCGKNDVLYYDRHEMNYGLCHQCITDENENQIICEKHLKKYDMDEIIEYRGCERKYNKYYDCKKIEYRVPCGCYICFSCDNFLSFNNSVVHFNDIVAKDSNSTDKLWNYFDSYEWCDGGFGRVTTHECKLCGYHFGDESPTYDLSLNKLLIKELSEKSKLLHEILCNKAPTYFYG